MNKYISVVALIGFLASLEGCYEPPEYPDSPIISFRDIRFVDLTDSQDSLILVFNFTDGDGDLGLNHTDVFAPYHRFNWVVDANDDPIELGDTSIVYPLILREQYGFKYQGPYSEDTIELPPYNCRDYYFIDDPLADSLDPDKTDTVLIQPNLYTNNIIVKFFRKRNGEYTDITDDFSLNNCQGSFSSRIPVFDESNFGRSLEGTITYPMLSSGFKSRFLNDSIMIEFFIVDRALHESNVVRTPDFTLPGLLGI